jgi:hypothetical protein
MRPNFGSKLLTLQTSASSFWAPTNFYFFAKTLQKSQPNFNHHFYGQDFSVNLFFLQALLAPTFEKLQQNKKKNTTISMCILFCQMLNINSQIMQANLAFTYLSSNYIWGIGP